MSGALSAAGTDGGSVVRLPRLWRAPAWADGDPVAELAQRLGDACASAVHADEIAALLESDGLTDEQITERYRHPDLFALAETLFALVPRAYPEPEPAADPWRTDVGRCILRGLTFALPGVAYVVGGRWAAGPDGYFGVSAAVAGWAVAALCSWGWNQALAHRAGLLLLAGRPRAAARCLLSGGAAGTALATAAAAAVMGPAHLPALAFAAGQALYMAAATALLVLRRERTLLYVLAPLTLAAACGAAALPSPAAAALLATTVTAATAAAAATALHPPNTELPAGARQNASRGLTARLRRRADASGSENDPRQAMDQSPPSSPASLTARLRRRRADASGSENDPRQAMGQSLPLSPARLTARLRRSRPGASRAESSPENGPRPAGLTARLRRRRRGAPQPETGPRPALWQSVPLGLAGLGAGGMVVAGALGGEFVGALTVSMGVAEWLLFRLRSRCLAAVHRTGVAQRLLGRSWRVLARCLGGYAAALVALAGVESAVLPGAAAWDAPHLGVLLALGCTLWLALLLQSCGRPWTAAAVLSAATATAVPLLALHTAAPGTVIGATGACSAAVLLAAATTVTARVTTHR